MRTRTPVPKRAELSQAWHLVDLDGQVLGRAAARVAMILQGKHRPTYTPHMDTGDFIVAINAEKALLTGKKAEQRRYYWYTGYPGGLKSVSIEERMATRPEEVFRTAVRRMLPKTTLGRKMLKKLKVYRGPDHPHQAQMPKLLDLQLRRAK
jgi:large subunit ribosomal protein L13